MPNKWTEKDLQILEQCYPTSTLDKMYVLLKGRHTHDSIRATASRYKIPKYLPPQKWKWTPAEERILTLYYPTEGARVIERFTRNKYTVSAIRCKAQQLGVERARGYRRNERRPRNPHQRLTLHRAKKTIETLEKANQELKRQADEMYKRLCAMEKKLNEVIPT